MKTDPCRTGRFCGKTQTPKKSDECPFPGTGFKWLYGITG